MAALELQILQNADVSIYFKMLLVCHFDITVMHIGYYTYQGPPTDTWIKNLNIMGIKDN